MDAESAAVLDTGATAALVCFKLLGHRKSVLEKREIPFTQPYPARAQFKFEGGRLGEARYEAGTPVRIARGLVNYSAFLLEADIPALLRKGASEVLGGQLDCARNFPT